jgi:hypothetical protein
VAQGGGHVAWVRHTDMSFEGMTAKSGTSLQGHVSTQYCGRMASQRPGTMLQSVKITQAGRKICLKTSVKIFLDRLLFGLAKFC